MVEEEKQEIEAEEPWMMMPWMRWSRMMRPWTRRMWMMMPSTREACTDLIDAGKEYQVYVEVPGIPKDKIDITVTKNGIEVAAKAEVERKGEEKGYVVRERGYSETYRRMSFPEEVLPEEAEAVLDNGVLEIKVPKKTPRQEVKEHKVEVN